MTYLEPMLEPMPPAGDLRAAGLRPYRTEPWVWMVWEGLFCLGEAIHCLADDEEEVIAFRPYPKAPATASYEHLLTYLRERPVQ